MRVIIRSFLLIFFIALSWNCNAKAGYFDFLSLGLIKSTCVAIVKSPGTFFSFIFREYGFTLQKDTDAIRENGKKLGAEIKESGKKKSDKNKEAILTGVSSLDESIKKYGANQKELSQSVEKRYDDLLVDTKNLAELSAKFKIHLNKQLQLLSNDVDKKNEDMLLSVDFQLDEFNHALEATDAKMSILKQEMEKKQLEHSQGIFQRVDLLKVSLTESLNKTTENIEFIGKNLKIFKSKLEETSQKIDGFDKKIDTLTENQKKINEKTMQLIDYNNGLLEENEKLKKQVAELSQVVSTRYFHNQSEDKKITLIMGGNLAYKNALSLIKK